MPQSNKETVEERFNKKFRPLKWDGFDENNIPLPSEVKDFSRSEINAKLDEVIREAEGVFEKYWPKISCVGKAIKDDGVRQSYHCIHCVENVWSEGDEIPICPLSCEPTADKASSSLIEIVKKLKE